MRKIVRLTERDITKLVKRVLREDDMSDSSDVVIFDKYGQEELRRLGFKDTKPLPSEFVLKNETLGYEIKVIAVKCSANNGKYNGMKIFINGKEYLNGNYDKCPDACWVTLKQDILKLSPLQ